jgi:hypothetical protein
MGGTSKQEQSSQQQSQLTPYAPATSGLQGILSALGPSIGNINGTPQLANAFGQLEANASAPNPLAAPAMSADTALLGGGQNYGTASNAVTGGLDAARSALSSYTSGNAFDPASNPALGAQLNAVGQQVQNTVNPVFSAAGRLASPANAQAVAQGITQGSAPILQNAASNQITAGGLLGSLGNSAGNTLGNLDQGQAGILGSGISNAGNAYGAQNLGPQELLSALITQGQLPIQNAGALSGILGPIAAQFGQQNSTGSQQGTSTMSGAQQFGTIAGGIGNLGKLFFS